ncbi:MAG: alkaline phosphatase [Propionivibrio sp.]|uniref:alkaline phosphatase n=1 Tax=Propionivibrio sp. TaxID=2212460 RepID=UPI001A39253C|nr:alkaline phosphatase [Propionivibrio sp.]MBL8415637.1 alkaline phosphatase [Propionivibrio sp.]
MNTPAFTRNCMHLMISAALASMASAAFSASPSTLTISRLTPPSNPIVSGASTLARFLPGQRFDLQATVQPIAGQAISSVEFKVDGVSVGTVTAGATCSDKVASGNKGMLPATAITASVPCAVAASIRAYSNSAAGMHTLTAKATQSDGAVVERSGNFEVVGIIPNNGRTAKNIIIMLGDGMGAAHRTAARIMVKGYAQGKAQGRLAMDTFPVTGMVMTSSLDSIVTDSAPGMANYVNGNKAANNQEGVFPDDTSDAFDNPRVEYLSEFLHRTKGTTLGIVTTADVFDATPAANAVHTSNRGNGTGIVDQYLDDRNLTGLTVLMGGGRKWFLSNPSNTTSPQPVNGSQRKNSSDYVLPGDIVAGWGAAAGALDASRDLIASFQSAGYTYAADKTAMDSAGVPDKLLGLFSFSNMNVAFDKINARRGASSIVNDYGFPDQPMLDEMTDKALQVLNKNNANGFVLMVEAASIDKQAHLMDSDRWILETIEFDRAIKKAQDFASTNPDTIVIVTADHECAGAAIIGAYSGGGAAKTSVLTYQDAKFPKYTINADGYPASTDVSGKMLIGYGANADRYETWQSNPQPTQDSQQPFVGSAPLNTYPANPNVRNSGTGYLVSGQVSGEQAVHTATDIPLSAYGRGASLFTGVFDNTDVFFKLGQIAVGGAK